MAKKAKAKARKPAANLQRVERTAPGYTAAQHKAQGVRIFPKAKDALRVRAVRPGYIHEERKREGDVFDISRDHCKVNKAGEHELPSWVEPTNPKDEVRTTGSPEALRREHKTLRQDKTAGATGGIEEDDDNPLD